MCKLLTRMGIFDMRITSKSIRHRVPFVDALSHFPDLCFESCNSIGEIINSINFRCAMCSAILLRDLAQRPFFRLLVWIAKVLGEMTFQLSHCLVVCVYELWKVFYISADGSSRY